MTKKQKIFLGIGATLFLILLGLFGVGYHLITKSFPKTSGTVTLAGLKNDLKVYRDEYGVPHIYAQSEHDAYFAVGFVHAQDRLWQMEIVRRAGMGRLAEVLGEPALPIDKMFHTLGIWKHAQKMLSPAIDVQTRQVIQAYADGVNAFIAQNKGKYPVEFDMLNIEPEPWTAEHSYLVSRLMAWELNYGRWVDILFGELVERFGETKARELFPTWPPDAPVIVPKQLKGKKVANLMRQFLDAERSYRALFGIQDLQTGSNAWVVSGTKSVTGKPLLANDPHLVLMAPARWYELHVVAPNLDVTGVSIPGVPFVIIGRNERIAWGLSNAMMDDEDFYVEQVDSIQHPTKYRFMNVWRPILETVDTILVKNALPVFFSIYTTHRGPIVNKLEPSAQFSKNLISMRWVGHEVSNEVRAFYLIDKASNWDEFREGLKHFAVPAQNFVYADVEGNIGYHTGGKLPIRKTKGPTLPFPGWTDEFDWKGYVPFNDLPHAFNPAEGFIATANNKIVDDSYPYHISHHWEPSWRAVRINEVLKEQERFSVEDFQRLQNDYVSPHAREIVPIILHAYDSVVVSDPDVRTALSYFRNWNFEMRKEDVSTTLFEATFLRIIRNTFEDEMGHQLLALYDTLATTPLTVTTRLLKDSASTWFDDVRTPVRETRDDIIRKSLGDAIQDLKNLLGGELKEWQWGRVHTVTFGHVFGASSLLKPIFSVGPYPVGGSHSTVNVGYFHLANPFANTVGPSTRQIFDLSNSNNTRSVTPPGQSGHVFHRNYNDQVALWLNGAYRKMTMDLSQVEQSCRDVLVLRPER